MLQQIHSAFHPDLLPSWLALIGFGAYHGLNPGMGWLFALSRGLQQQSARAVWTSLVPIALGHATAIAAVAVLVMAAGHLIDQRALRVTTAAILLAFGLYKLFRFYRHPRWVGMRVGMRDLFVWSLLMASAHGAGLMVAPILISLGSHHAHRERPSFEGFIMIAAVALHTLAMLAVMGLIAWIVYTKLGLGILKKGWFNFDLIWACALLIVGLFAMYGALTDGHSRHHHPGATAQPAAESVCCTGEPCSEPSVRPSRSEPQFGSMPSTTVARIYDSMRTASPAG